MSDDTLASARRRVREALGSSFAAKASDVFCLAYASGAWSDNRRIVVEMAPPPGEGEASGRVMRGGHSGGGIRGGGPPLWPGGEATRAAYVQDSKMRALAAMAPISNYLVRHDPEATNNRTGATTGLGPRVCWLNHSVRSAAPVRVVADIAGDPRVLHIDLPRPLVPELRHSRVALGLTGIRGSFTRQRPYDPEKKGIVVAVIDSEVAHLHPALQGRVLQRQRFTREDWGHPDRHGTAVAGIIAARGDTVLGIAPDTVIYNYKVLAGCSEDADDADLWCAIMSALEDGARIANVSLGTRAETDGRSREARACDAAWAQGMTIVKSAGNGGSRPGTITCPGDARGAIVVGATDRDGKGVQPYSSRGPTRNGKPGPDLVAPGGTDDVGIESCLPDGTFGDCGCGTTLAAPHVTGLLALMLEEEPELTPDQQRERLLEMCRPMGGNEEARGRGLPSLQTLAAATA